MNEIGCSKCGSVNTEQSISVFRNNTKHLLVKCKDCRYSFYAPKRLITNDLKEAPSKKLKKQREELAQIIFGIDL